MNTQLAAVAGLHAEKMQMQEKLAKIQGQLDELQCGLNEAGVADKHDLLLLAERARSVMLHPPASHAESARYLVLTPSNTLPALLQDRYVIPGFHSPSNV